MARTDGRRRAQSIDGVEIVDGGSHAQGRCTAASQAAGDRYFDVGIVKSAPLGVDAGQRCITDFCRV